MNQRIRRGSIVMASLDPAVGSEAAKTRPVIVVANNASISSAFHNDGTVAIVPLTSNVRHVRAFQVLLPRESTGLPRDSKAQLEQIRTISVRRVAGIVGWVPGELMAAVDDGLRLHLAV